MTVTIRPGRQTDVATCIDILRDWADETPWMVGLNDRATMRAFWSQLFRTDLVWVAEQGDGIVGFCTRGADNIGALYVASEARGSGIGKRMLDKAKADRDWITVWAYEQNTQARKFYRREGLVELSREIEDGSDLMNVEHRWVRKD